MELLKDGAIDVDDAEKPNGVNGIAKSSKAKGKMPASDEDDDEDSEEDSEGGEIEEFVICTLDPNQVGLLRPRSLSLST